MYKMKISSKTRAHIYDRDGYVCLRCNSKCDLTIGHIIPISKGGVNRMGNMQTLCENCNIEKGDLIVDYRWIEHIPQSWFNLSTPISEIGSEKEILPVIAEKIIKKTRQLTKVHNNHNVNNMDFYDNPILLNKDKQLYLQRQTPEQFRLAKKHGWVVAMMLTEEQKNFHEN